jgi:5'-AMP-activated protein kinase catalytic alpha subunit
VPLWTLLGAFIGPFSPRTITVILAVDLRIGTHTITNEQVAIKILEKDKIKDKADVERVTREINILKKVRHPNVIQLYEVKKRQFRINSFLSL